MASKLPIEILDRILRNFLSSDENFSIKDLYPSLLVNWQWCETVIPLLWSQPFQFGSKMKNNYKILDTYFCFLNDTERKSIVVQNNFLKRILGPNTGRQRRAKNFSNLNKHPMYDYPFFAKHLDVGAMMYAAETWCTSNRLPYHKSIIVTAILSLMQRNGATIEKLSGPFRFTTRREFLSLFEQNPHLEMWISSVKSCHMVWNDYMDQSQRPLTIAALSNHLECLDISMKGIENISQKHSLATIGATMRQFHGLNQFILRCCAGDVNSIFKNLQLSASTLLEIDFVDIDFANSDPLNSFLMFDNIEVISFRQCCNLSFRVMQPLMAVPFMHLHHVRLVNIIDCTDISEHIREWAQEINNRSRYAC
ncbi:hypothetical protein G9A89_010203 [Geosiphon pyriformis]|nr:hypothetical protein G9A89_010203 [Geosiphon pyriformis]